MSAVKCNFGTELGNYLRDHLIAGINDAALQKKMLLEERPTCSSLRTLCEKFEELPFSYTSARTGDNNTIKCMKFLCIVPVPPNLRPK